MRKVLFSILPLILIGCKKSKPLPYPVEFFKEKVIINIDSSSVFVEGLYWFRNLSKDSLSLPTFFPFPVDSTHLYPDFIYLFQNRALPFLKSDTGIYFKIMMEPKSEVLFKVYYHQKIKEPSAQYIITTLKKWKKPIQKADFIITLPKDFPSINLSYPPDSIRERNNKKYYFITKKNFMPEKDILIHW